MLKFTKMHGLGNDYVFIYLGDYILTNPENLARKISNRNFGIGSDGLITISKSNIADFKMEIYNSDGTIANMCGNGIRCVGKFVWDKGLTKKTDLIIETKSGLKKVSLKIDKGCKVKSVEVDMGMVKLINVSEIVIDNINFKIYFVDIGNLHGVIKIDGDVDYYARKYGKYISQLYESKINVEFVRIISKNKIKMAVYERGSGITLACGTGACASYYVMMLEDTLLPSGEVLLRNGTLKISITESDNVIMEGDAVTTFDGEYFNS